MGNLIKRNTIGRVRGAYDAVEDRIAGIDSSIDYVVERTGYRLGKSLAAKFIANKGRQLGKLDTDVKYNVFNTMNPEVSVLRNKLMVSAKALERAYNQEKPLSEQMRFILGDDGIMRYQYKYALDKDTNNVMKDDEGNMALSREKPLPMTKWKTDAQEHLQTELSSLIDHLGQQTASKAVIASIMGAETISFRVKKNGTMRDKPFTLNVDQVYDLLSGKKLQGYFAQGSLHDQITKNIKKTLIKKAQKNRKDMHIQARGQLDQEIFGKKLSDVNKKEESAYAHIFKHDHGRGLRSGGQEETMTIRSNNNPEKNTSDIGNSEKKESISTYDINVSIQMQRYIDHAKDYTRTEANNYLEKRYQEERMTEKEYHKRQQKINNTPFNGESIVSAA